MNRAYRLVAWSLVLVVSVLLLALWFSPPREPIGHDGWRDLERVDSV